MVKKFLNALIITGYILVFGGLILIVLLEAKLLKLPENELANFEAKFLASPPPVPFFRTPIRTATISPNPSPINNIYKVQFTGKLETDIPTVFTDSKYQRIVTLINSSQNESDLTTKYQDYKTVFNLISSAYNETKNPDFFLALLEVRSKALVLNDFQTADLPLPK